jgi:hypothetical protein
VTHPTGVRNGLADHVVDQIDSGTADAAGDLIITDGGATPSTLVTIVLQDPAFGSAASGTADMQGSSTGTAAEFQLRNKDNSPIFTGTVGTTGSDMNLSNTSIASGDKVQITSFSYTAPN